MTFNPKNHYCKPELDALREHYSIEQPWTWPFKVVDVLYDKERLGPASMEEAHYIQYEIWDQYSNTVASFGSLSHAISAAISMNNEVLLE